MRAADDFGTRGQTGTDDCGEMIYSSEDERVMKAAINLTSNVTFNQLRGQRDCKDTSNRDKEGIQDKQITEQALR